MLLFTGRPFRELKGFFWRSTRCRVKSSALQPHCKCKTCLLNSSVYRQVGSQWSWFKQTSARAWFTSLQLAQSESFITKFMAEGISIHDPNAQEVKPTSVTFEGPFISRPPGYCLLLFCSRTQCDELINFWNAQCLIEPNKSWGPCSGLQSFSPR